MNALGNVYCLIRLCVLMLIITSSHVLNAQDTPTQPDTNNVDFIIFSHDRPLQLYALLESAAVHLTGLRSVHVIYRTSSADYERAYDELKHVFIDVDFLQQKDPPHDFKQLVMQALTTAGDYLMFAVDDQIVKDAVDLSYCVSMLEKTGAYGFYLELGDHLDQFYELQFLAAYNVPPYKVPPLSLVQDDVCTWQFCTGIYHWNYPHMMDTVIYRTPDIVACATPLAFNSPNSFEIALGGNTHHLRTSYGLCFKNSKTLNTPLNVVQHDYNANAMIDYPAQKLFEHFCNGLKIDVTPFFGLRNRATHIEWQPNFVSRDKSVKFLLRIRDI